MTSAKDLRTMFDYGYWATGQLLGVVGELTEEEFTRPVGGSYGSVRSTLVHVLSAEWGWLERCGGAKRGPALKAVDYPSVESVVVSWREVEAKVREFLEELKDEDLERVVAFSFGEGLAGELRVGELMHHAAIHGVHHRGQVSLLLRLLGKAPGNFDIVFYYGRQD